MDFKFEFENSIKILMKLNYIANKAIQFCACLSAK